MLSIIEKRFKLNRKPNPFEGLEVEERRRRYLLIWCTLLAFIPLWASAFWTRRSPSWP